MITCQIKVRNNVSSVEVIADEGKDTITYNGKFARRGASKFISKVLAITDRWPEEDNNNKVIDGENYEVKIFFEDETRVHKGYGTYPYRYDEFKKLISEVSL